MFDTYILRKGVKQSSQWIVSQPDNLVRKQLTKTPPSHTFHWMCGFLSGGGVSEAFPYVTCYFNMQGFEQSKNAIAGNLSAPPQPNSFLYTNSSASTCLWLQFCLYFSTGLLKHHLIHLGAAVV